VIVPRSKISGHASNTNFCSESLAMSGRGKQDEEGAIELDATMTITDIVEGGFLKVRWNHTSFLVAPMILPELARCPQTNQCHGVAGWVWRHSST